MRECSVHCSVFVFLMATTPTLKLTETIRGGPCLVVDGFKFRRVKRADESIIPWRYVNILSYLTPTRVHVWGIYKGGRVWEFPAQLKLRVARRGTPGHEPPGPSVIG